MKVRVQLARGLAHTLPLFTHPEGTRGGGVAPLWPAVPEPRGVHGLVVLLDSAPGGHYGANPHHFVGSPPSRTFRRPRAAEAVLEHLDASLRARPPQPPLAPRIPSSVIAYGVLRRMNARPCV